MSEGTGPTARALKPSVSDMLLCTWPPIIVGMCLYLAGRYAQPDFCPSNTVLAGNLRIAIGLGVSSVAVGTGVAAICLGAVFRRMAGPKAVYRRRLMRTLGFIVVVLPLASWLNAVMSFFCANTQAVTLHTGIFDRPVVLTWSNVRTAEPICSWRSNRQVTDSILGLGLNMADGYQATLEFPSGRLEKRYSELRPVIASLPRASSFASWEKSFPCPPTYLDVFTGR
jgi:hypothetical protein